MEVREILKEKDLSKLECERSNVFQAEGELELKDREVGGNEEVKEGWNAKCLPLRANG